MALKISGFALFWQQCKWCVKCFSPSLQSWELNCRHWCWARVTRGSGEEAKLSLEDSCSKSLRTGAYFLVELPVACFFKLASISHYFKLYPDDSGRTFSKEGEWMATALLNIEQGWLQWSPQTWKVRTPGLMLFVNSIVRNIGLILVELLLTGTQNQDTDKIGRLP